MQGTDVSITRQALSEALLTSCIPTTALGGQALSSCMVKEKKAQRGSNIGPGPYKYKMTVTGLYTQGCRKYLFMESCSALLPTEALLSLSYECHRQGRMGIRVMQGTQL